MVCGENTDFYFCCLDVNCLLGNNELFGFMVVSCHNAFGRKRWMMIWPPFPPPFQRRPSYSVFVE